MKSIIVDIEDHELRDTLLSILTKLSNRSTECDEAMTLIMDQLVSRVRHLLVTNKELQTKVNILQTTDDQYRELEIQKDLVANQLEAASAEGARVNALL